MKKQLTFSVLTLALIFMVFGCSRLESSDSNNWFEPDGIDINMLSQNKNCVEGDDYTAKFELNYDHVHISIVGASINGTMTVPKWNNRLVWVTGTCQAGEMELVLRVEYRSSHVIGGTRYSHYSWTVQGE